MFGIGTGELLLLLVIALLVLGPERMPKLARDIGKTVGDLRRTSDELRQEFMNADRVLDVVARRGERPAAIAEVNTDEAAPGAPVAPGAPLAAVTPGAPVAPGAPVDEADATAAPAMAPTETPEPDETAFDREAREARERLEDPERQRRAEVEGWKIPTDEAGTSGDRWG
ncbi:MAG: twin-arginine translocase TatA/TatE family subunit [Chloroflexota bacterium]